jgi:hypothetical protein
MIEPDEVKFKDAEIRWCWEMFDRIIELTEKNAVDPQIIHQINLHAKLGLKGRKDEWDK